MVTAAAARGLVVPAACEPLPTLLGPDLPRARLLARLALWLSRTGDELRPLWIDLGQQGRSVDEAAAALRRRACTEVAVVGTPHDGGACRLLAEALCAEGLEAVGGACVPLGEQALQEWWGSVPGTATARGDTEPGSGDEFAMGSSGWPLLLVVDGSDAHGEARLASQGVVFRAQGATVLTRVTAGPVPGVPSAIERIVVQRHRDLVDDAPLHDDASTLHLLALPAWPDPDRPEVIDRLARRLSACEPSRVRLVLDPLPAAPVGRAGGSPWAARCGLLILGTGRVDERAVAGLVQLVALLFPDRLGELSLALSWLSAGLSPLEQMTARRGLPDRNAELLQNIVP